MWKCCEELEDSKGFLNPRVQGEGRARLIKRSLKTITPDLSTQSLSSYCSCWDPSCIVKQT